MKPLILALAILVSAQVAPTSSVIDSTQLLSDLKMLSSDAMEGRAPGTPGGDKARAFVIDRFKVSGIVPFGTSYEQEFNYSVRGGARKGVNVIGRIDGTK